MGTLTIRPGLSLVAVLQGIYWLVTGVWPFIHLKSFVWVTGPKNDYWLLYTVSVLITVIGGTLLAAGIRGRVTPEVRWLGIGGAAGLMGVDVYYALGDVIRNIYLLDAVGEAALLMLWFWSGSRGLKE